MYENVRVSENLENIFFFTNKMLSTMITLLLSMRFDKNTKRLYYY